MSTTHMNQLTPVAPNLYVVKSDERFSIHYIGEGKYNLITELTSVEGFTPKVFDSIPEALVHVETFTKRDNKTDYPKCAKCQSRMPEMWIRCAYCGVFAPHATEEQKTQARKETVEANAMRQIDQNLPKINDDLFLDIVRAQIYHRHLETQTAILALCSLDQTGAANEDLTEAIAKALTIHVEAQIADAAHCGIKLNPKAILGGFLTTIASKCKV